MQLTMELEQVATEAINPYDFKKGDHDFMQCRFDPSGLIPKEYGKFKVNEWRESFDHWAEGSIWEGGGGFWGDQLYCKKGRFLVECSHDRIPFGWQSSIERETEKRQERSLLYA